MTANTLALPVELPSLAGHSAPKEQLHAELVAHPYRFLDVELEAEKGCVMCKIVISICIQSTCTSSSAVSVGTLTAGTTISGWIGDVN